MIKKYPIILDGGLSNVLEELGFDLNHKLWTASLIEKNPKAIIQAHLEYLKSGAQFITTSSYQASIPGLIEIGYSYEAAKSLILKSVELAEIAIQRAIDSGIINHKPLIAASIGPYGAYLADGSEYRGNYGISDEALKKFHQEKITLLEQSNADVLAFETIPSFQEAKVLSEILNHVKKPSWISFSCKDEDHVNDGSTIKNCAELFENQSKVFAVGVNCTHPKYISTIIQQLKSNIGDKQIIVYPNSGEAYNANNKTWLGVSKPAFFEEMAKEWSLLGADIIGGCCRIGPMHIKKVSAVLQEIKN